MSKYTNTQIKEATKHALELKGEHYIYEKRAGGCVYAVQGEPSCLVGHIFAEIDPEAFKKLAELDFTDDSSLPEAILEGILDLTYEQECALGRAQRAQDEGVAWGEAVEEILALD